MFIALVVTTFYMFYITGKPAKQSSTFIDTRSYPHLVHEASYANDGVYRPLFPNITYELSSLAHSLREDNPWWRVDLLRVHCIWAVNILNRGDSK